MEIGHRRRARSGWHDVRQLWHVSRIPHTSLQPEGKVPFSSPSKQVDDPRFKVFSFRDDGSQGCVDPSTQEVDFT